MNIEEQYLSLLDKILKEGVRKENRTGLDTIAIAGTMLEHDMSEGFPLLTTKKVSFKNVASELEFFIKGLSDKKWLQDRGNKIWNEWCNPQKVPYGNDEESKMRMLEERDLGDVYGVVWRGKSKYQHVDQLANIVNKLKIDPENRRMVCSAWSPMDAPSQALPPCHYSFQVTVLDGKVNLLFNMRSWDVFLGAPYNLASYALLLHLLTLEVNKYRLENNLEPFSEGKLVCFAADVHIYVNHIEQCNLQLSRKPFRLPTVATEKFESIFDWKYIDTKIINYKSHPPIRGEIAV